MTPQRTDKAMIYRWRIFLPVLLLIAAGGALVLGEPAQAGTPPTRDKKVLPPAPPTIPVTPLPTSTPGGPVPSATIAPPTITPGGPPPPVPTGYPTVVACNSFSDVGSGDWYYQYVHWMACNGIAGGYSDGSFRPGNPTTRGQTTKMLVGAFGLPLDTSGGPTFADVAPSNSFYTFIETAARQGIISGYACGSVPEEPCDSANQPYFRPNNHVTRSQIAKIVVLTAIYAAPERWILITPQQATFYDVPTDSPFFSYIETAVAYNIIQGYECGGDSEPCPGRYFRPQANATRAQISKITYLAVLLPGQ